MEITDPHIDTTVRARLRARARRVEILRRRVVAVALSSFVLVWGVIYTTGSMGAQTAATASSAPRLASTQSSSGTSSSTTSSSSDGGSSSSDSGSSSSSSASSPTTVTTSQS